MRHDVCNRVECVKVGGCGEERCSHSVATMQSLGDDVVRAFERACAAENYDSVASKQYFDDWVRSLSSMVRRHVLTACVEHLPGMEGGDAYKVKVVFESAKLGAPVSVNSAGDVDNCLTPTRARMQNLTYAAPLYVNIRVETQEPSPNGVVYKGSSESEVFLGTIPVMVGSQSCTTQITGDASAEIDSGGYFIIKGNEKIIPFFRSTDVYSTVCYEGSEKQTYATVRSGASYGKIVSTRLRKSMDAPAQMKFARSSQLGDDVTPGLVLSILGVKDPVSDVFANLLSEDAAFYGKGSFDVPETSFAADAPADVVEGVFPTTERHLKARAVVSAMRVARHMRETNNLTHRDSLQSQQLEGVREIMTEVFDKNMRGTIKTMRQRLETRLRKLHDQRHDNKRHRVATLQMPNAGWVADHLKKCNCVGPGVHYFFATGNFQCGGGRERARTRKGCCQILERTSELQMQSCMNKVVTPLDAQSAPVCAREFRLDMLSYLCPCATPEGKRTGLVNSRAVGCSVSRDRFDCVSAVLDMARHFMRDDVPHYGARAAGVWISGAFVGCTERPVQLAAALRAARRSGQLPRDVGVSLYGVVGVEVRVHSGRMLKPLLPLQDGAISGHCALQSLHTTWSHLIHSGVIETLDTREEGGAMVCAWDSTPTRRHTHKEMFPTASLGCCAATIPFCDLEPSPRAAYFTSQAQQAMGFDMRNHTRGRMDTKSYGLWYPQRSLVTTSYQRSSKSEERAPVGVNVVVAIMSLQGAEEDAILVNKAAVDRGLFRGTQWDTKTVKTADRTPKYFASPAESELDPSGGSLDFRTGIAKVGSVVRSGDAYAALASSSGVRAIKHANALPATVERVVVFDDVEGQRTAKVKLRTDRPLAVGDKLSSRYAQKGVCSRLVEAHDMPFCEDGSMIDIIVNPCMLPSRMTVGSLLEMVSGFAAAELGLDHVDATAFAHSTMSVIADLRRRGFKTNAKWLRDPFTGERYPQKIEIGIAKYNRLNKYASDKMRVRRRGRRDAITGQPVGGKGSGNMAQRFGDMETSAISSHGGSATLDDACRGRSDGTTTLACERCGNTHLRGRTAPCPACGGDAVEIQSTKATICMMQVCEAMGVGLQLHVERHEE